MAGEERKEREFRFSLPLVFKKRKKKNLDNLKKDEYKDIFDYIDQFGLRTHLQQSLPCIDLHNLFLVDLDKNEILLGLTVRSAKQLTDIYEVAKELEGNRQNSLSKSIHEYLESVSTELAIGFQLGTSLSVSAVMTTKQLRKGLIELDDIDDDGNDIESTPETNKQTQKGQQVASPDIKSQTNVKDTVRHIEKKAVHSETHQRTQGHSEMQQRTQGHSEMQQRTQGHPETHLRTQGHSEMQQRTQGHSEMQQRTQGHSETQQRTRGHSETQQRTQGHSEMHQRTQGHSEMQQRTQGHSEMQQRTQGHSESHQRAQGHSEMQQRTQGHSETQQRTQGHSETQQRAQGHSEMQQRTQEHSETEQRTQGHSEMQQRTQEHPETQQRTQGHSEMQQRTQGHSEMQQRTQGHSETQQRTQGHSETQERTQGHSETHQRTQGHSEVQQRTQGYSEMQQRTQGHSEMHQRAQGHSETQQRTQGHSETEQRTQGHSEMQQRTQGHSEMQQRTQEHSETQQRTQGEVRSIDKVLIVFIPTNKEFISSVKLVSEDNRLDGYFLKPHGTEHNMFEISLSIPSIGFKNISYNYEVTTSRYKVLSVFNSFITIYPTKCYRFNGELFQRDIIDGFEMECITKHLEDILFFSSMRSDTDHILCCIHEIENLLVILKENFKLKYFQDLMSELFKTMDYRGTVKAYFLLLVIIGNCLRSLNTIKSVKEIDPRASRKLLDAACNFHLNKLPESCQEYMVELCLNLSQICFENKYCLLRFIDICHPFLNESHFNVVIDQYLLRKNKLDFVDEKDKALVPVARSICLRLCNVHICGDDGEALKLLKRLLYHLPFHFMIDIGKALLKNIETTLPPESSAVKDEIFEIINNSVKMEIIQVKKRDDLGEMRQLWERIKENFKVPQEIIAHFEKEIIEMITFGKRKDIHSKTDDLGSLISDEVLFSKNEKQYLLIRSLCDSSTFSVHEQFITCVKNDKFAIVFQENMKTACDTWLKRAIETHLPKYKCNEICSPYVALSKLLKVEVIKSNNEVNSSMLGMIYKHLQRSHLQHILSKLDDQLEDIGGPKCFEIFKMHVAELIKRKYHSQKPEDLLKCICTHNFLIVNSSITASTVCLILDEILNVTNTTNEFELFEKLSTQSESWKLIFNGKGKMMHAVKSNCNFQRAELCINKISKKLKQYEVAYPFMCVFNQQSKRDDANELLERDSHTRFEKIWIENEKIFKRHLEDIDVVNTVLSGISKYVPESKLPNDFQKRKDNLRTFEENVRQTLLAIDLKGKSFPSAMADLMSNCSFLVKIVHSVVFWNVSLGSIHTSLIGKLPETPPDDIVESVELLFQDEEQENTDSGDNTCLHRSNGYQLNTFLDVVLEKGGHSFRDQWMALMRDQDYPLSDCIQMFKGANFSEEIQLAEAFMNTKVTQEVKVTLKQLNDLQRIKSSVYAMKRCLQSCKIDDEVFLTAIKSFENAMSRDGSARSFNDVGKSLKTVFEMAEPLSEDTIAVLQTIGGASNLIDFLSKIVDEDIRNLIDAVEDISEQHVQETSVAALIEVKRFLQPVFKSELQGNAKGLFELINKQVHANPGLGSAIPVKIEDCMSNLHNLKSLYNNVANRSEQTKEKILNIVKMGKFQFNLNNLGTGCDFSASYTVKKLKSCHSKSALVDLRSRALLLVNKQESKTGTKGNELDSFVSFIDTCIDISVLIVTLHSTGHIKYKVFKQVEEAGNLLELKQHLSFEYKNWCVHLESVRSRFYLINSLQGFQIHKLHTCLESHEHTERVMKYEQEAQTFLKAIHPNIQLVTFKKHYTNYKSHQVCDEYTFIEYIGQALHDCFKSIELFQRPLNCESVKEKKLEDVVQKGRLLVVQLDESSLLVVRTVLTLYYNTVQRLPEPNQIIFCSRQTRWAEIELLLQRCLGSSEFYGEDVLYCVTNVELLPNEVQFKLVEALRNLESDQSYLFAVICRGSKNHPFIDELGEFVTNVRPLSDKIIEGILHRECPSVTTVTSNVAGLGKTTHLIKKAFFSGRSIATLHISGPMTKDRIVSGLISLHIKEFNTLHIDIGSLASTLELDTFLFELIVLRFVSTGKTSVYLPTSSVSIEIANSLQDGLRKSLQTAILFQREHLEWQNYDDYIFSREVNSPVQVVCQFLLQLRKGTLDSFDISFSGNNTVKRMSCKTCKEILRMNFPSYPGISFNIINVFLNVLADQLKKLSSSSFFRTSRIKDMLGHKTTPTVRSSLVRELVDVSKEFSSRSVDTCRATQMSTMGFSTQLENSKPVSVAEGLTKQVEGMIRWEDSNHLMYVFHNQNIQTISPIYRDRTKVPSHIKNLFESQMKKEMQDYKKMAQSELQVILQKICRSNPQMLPVKTLSEMSSGYALTPDNLLKMILIILRVKAGIPVLVMGETGCGKTSLIRYLAQICEVKFKVLNIHAGVEETAIIDTVLSCNSEALKNITEQYWLFFDEINTSEYVGVISDIICHHNFNGESLSPNLIVMGACNPYKLRSEKAISTAGLKGKIMTDELSRLVYRVLPLPEMLVDYVWDFGSLNESDEKTYISRMTEGVFKNDKQYHTLLSELLSMSQTFIRCHEHGSCSVSLRDVQRCKTLTIWFMEILKKKGPRKTTFTAYIKANTKEKAIVLALAHCYHSRISDMTLRKKYREHIAEICWKNCSDFSERDVHDVIKGEQEDILNRMDLPPGTAKNTALRENVFILLVCILNRIPIFVVGKPGCSKSLSMQVIRNNLRGEDSKDKFFKTLPQLYCVSFQGSESSTSDGIIKVFEKAEKYQETNRADSVLSVVILDEIGLAEVSRFNPLKVLHNLLEPDGKDRPNVAVVGISNWSLDASKMNRAIHLSRPEMDEEELFETGKSISDSFVAVDKSSNKMDLSQMFLSSHNKSLFKTSFIENDLRRIAKSYFKYTAKLAFKNFHGLRDFYSLVKYFAKEVSRDSDISTEEKMLIMMTGIERNFGGLPAERQSLLTEFQVEDMAQSCPVIGLIKSNIDDPFARHLMLITTGESVLGILEQHLNDIGRQNREVIFGSQFEEDLTDDYNYRILNRIILCMEQGLVLILKDLENIYGSLYDMLNQNYTIIGKKKNCRVALGPYSNPICHVADNFRCIVLVDDSKLEYSDPPFLNRFEKQYLRFSDIISPEQRAIITKLEDWVSDVSVYKDFGELDAFPIFSEDMVSSLILQNYRTNLTEDQIVFNCKLDLLWIIKPEVIVRLSRNSCDTLSHELDELVESYLTLPIHRGIVGLLELQLQTKDIIDCLMCIVFTNSNIHTKVLQKIALFRIQSEKLGAFKSEKQLSSRMKAFWLESDSEILFLQCSAVEDERHIMLAKSAIEKFRQEFLSTRLDGDIKHVYLVVHLDRSKGYSNILSQINFMSNWKLITLDSLEEPKTTLPELCKQSLLDALIAKRPLNDFIKEQLFWSFTRIKYKLGGRSFESLTALLTKIKNSENFLSILDTLIVSSIKKFFPDIGDKEWQMRVACNRQSLQTASSFIDALEAHILEIISVPLVKYVFVMETEHMLDTFFIDDAYSDERIDIWKTIISQEERFSIAKIPDNSGPESYICHAYAVELKMPFSKYIFDSVETTSEEYLYSVKLLKSACGLDLEDTLPGEILFELQKKQESIVDQKLPRLLTYDYVSAMEDYFDDFCNIISVRICPSLLALDRIQYTKLIVGEHISFEGTDLLKGITLLHITIWNHLTVFSSHLQLFETCRELLTPDDLHELTFKHHTTEILPGKVNGDQIEKYGYVNNDKDEEGFIYLNDHGDKANLETSFEAEEDIDLVGDQNLSSSENENIEMLNDNLIQQHFVSSCSGNLEYEEKPSTIDSAHEAREIASALSLENAVTKDGLKIFPQQMLPCVELKNTYEEHETDTDFELKVNCVQCFGTSQSEPSKLSPSGVKVKVCREHGKEFCELIESSDEKCLISHELDIELHDKEQSFGQKENSGEEVQQDVSNVVDRTYQSEPLISNPSEIEEIVYHENKKIFVSLAELFDEDQSTNVLFGKDKAGEILLLNQKDDQVAKALDGLINDSENEGFEEKISMTEVEEQTEMKDILVEMVCQRMLPTQTTIEHYSSMNDWLLKTNEVLSLVAQVNPGSKFIHHLRISADIVSSLELPSQMDRNLFKMFAYSVQSEKSLDSNNVLKALMAIIKETAIKYAAKCQRLLASYFLRCLLSNPDSEAIFGLLDLVCTDKLPNKNVAAFKPVLCFALECEQAVEEDFLFHILRNGADCEKTDGDSMRENGFIIKLNATIKYLHETGRSQCTFVVLIVDIIEDIFCLHISKLDKKSDKFYGLLEDLIGSQTALIRQSFDLQFIVASSFFKAFVKHLTCDISSADKKIAGYVNALLTRKADNVIVYTMEAYVLKWLSRDKSRSCIKRDIDKLAGVLPNLNKIHMPVEDALRDASIDRCPLLMFLSPDRQKDAVMLMDRVNPESENNVNDLIDEINTRDEGLLLLFAYAEMTFYIPRSYQVLDDKTKSEAKSIAKQARESSLDIKYSHFLQCLLGTEDFRMAYLSQSEQSSTSDILLNSFLVSLFSCCLVSGYKKEDKNFFLDILLSPCTVENMFLPGYPGVDEKGELYNKPLQSNLSGLTDCIFTNCECQHRIVIWPPFARNLECPSCSKILRLETNLKPKEELEVESRGFTSGRITDLFYTARNLSPLACQILFMLMKGCLIGSLALGHEISERLENLLHLPAIDIPQTLWTDVNLHWTNIGNLINVGNYSVGNFLQTVLLYTQDFVFGKYDTMGSALDRLVWEDEFERRLQSVVVNRFAYHRQMVKHYRLLSNQSNMLEDALFEVDNSAKGSMSEIFRQKSTPSYDNFVSELFPMRERFPLLCLIMSLEDELHLPAHIKPIMQWHMAVVSTANYAMRKHECLNMTVTDFIQQAGGKEKTDILRTSFGQIQESWKYLKINLNRDIVKQMINMHCDLKMEDCIMFSPDCVMYRLLKHLLEIQNEILDKILVLSKSCESLQFLMRSETMSIIPYVNVADVSQTHLLQFNDNEFDWVEVIEENSVCDTTYGHGQNIWYDFETIEKLLVNRLVPGKAFVILNTLPQIVFTDELYKNYVSLSNDIKHKVKQKPLSPDILKAIEDKQKNDPRICRELLIQVGMIMTLLNKTGGDPDKCFIDYVEEVKNILTKKFSDDLLPDPTNAIKLGNIVALYETLEEINADTLIDALDDAYRYELDLDQVTMYETMVKKNKWLGNCVLRACKRFINRCLSLREADASRPLLEYVAEGAFWPDGVFVGAHLRIGEDEELLEDIFPITVMVKHIYYLVNVIETGIEKMIIESMKMSKMATSWHNTQKHVPLSKDARKKKAVTNRRRKTPL